MPFNVWISPDYLVYPFKPLTSKNFVQVPNNSISNGILGRTRRLRYTHNAGMLYYRVLFGVVEADGTAGNVLRVQARLAL